MADKSGKDYPLLDVDTYVWVDQREVEGLDDPIKIYRAGRNVSGYETNEIMDDVAGKALRDSLNYQNQMRGYLRKNDLSYNEAQEEFSQLWRELNDAYDDGDTDRIEEIRDMISPSQ